MTKSQQYFQDMMDSHEELFASFQIIHDKYASDPKTYQREFNEAGDEVMSIIRRYENMLCNQSESGKFGKFSNKTSETFWKFIRGKFPQIDFIGMLQ